MYPQKEQLHSDNIATHPGAIWSFSEALQYVTLSSPFTVPLQAKQTLSLRPDTLAQIWLLEMLSLGEYSD